MVPTLLACGLLLGVSYGHHSLDRLVTSYAGSFTSTLHPKLLQYTKQFVQHVGLLYFRYLTMLASPSFCKLNASQRLSYAYTLPQLWLMVSSIPTATAAVSYYTPATSAANSFDGGSGGGGSGGGQAALLFGQFDVGSRDTPGEGAAAAAAATLADGPAAWLVGTHPSWLGLKAKYFLVDIVADHISLRVVRGILTGLVSPFTAMISPYFTATFSSHASSYIQWAAMVPSWLDYVAATTITSAFLFATLVQIDTAIAITHDYVWWAGWQVVAGGFGLAAMVGLSTARIASVSMPNKLSNLFVESSAEPSASILQHCLSYVPPLSSMLLAAGTHYSLGTVAIPSMIGPPPVTSAHGTNHQLPFRIGSKLPHLC